MQYEKQLMMIFAFVLNFVYHEISNVVDKQGISVLLAYALKFWGFRKHVVLTGSAHLRFNL